LDRGGNVVGRLGDAANWLNPALSPDETKLAVSRDGDIWIFDTTTGNSNRFTFGPAEDDSPVWSPDGFSAAFSSKRTGHQDIYQKNINTGVEQRLLTSTIDKWPTSWSPNGDFLLYDQSGPGLFDMFVLPMKGERKPQAVQQTPMTESSLHFSPDGRWFTYSSNESGVYQIAVQPFPPTGVKWLVSKDGAFGDAAWHRDGREFFYVDASSNFLAAEVKPGDTFQTGPFRRLFHRRVNVWTWMRNVFVPAANGQRFLVNAVAEGPLSSSVTVILNWQSQLKK